MLSTTHAAAGAVIGALCPHPAAAATAGWCSHFVLDALPHWGSSNPERFLRVARIDGLAMGALSCALVARAPRHRRNSVAAGVFAAVAPDLNKPVRHFFGRQLYPQALERFHSRVQVGRESDTRLASEALRALLAASLAWQVVRRLR